MADQSTSLSSIVFCWILERRDGAGVALTSHDQALVLKDVVHQPASGILPLRSSDARGSMWKPRK